MSFFAAGYAWLLLLIPPLVIFYFLKLKREKLEVPSLMLWRQVLQDQRVNSPFQRFKRNILLLLQLLLLVLLIVSAMQPYSKGEAELAEYVPIIIDTSASMAAVDKAGGTSRLDDAKRRVTQLIENLRQDQQVSLIACSHTARRLTGFTNNRRILEQALAELEPDEIASNLEDALRLVQAISRTNPFERVLLYSDGNFPTKTAFDLPFKVDYQVLEPAGQNLGITQFNAQRTGRGSWDVFASIEGSATQPMPASVELLKDGKTISTQDVSISIDRPQQLVFSVETDRACALELKLKPDGFDSLASDNRAYLDLSNARPANVMVSKTLGAFAAALRASQDVVLTSDPKAQPESGFDLVIADNLADAQAPAKLTLLVGVLPEALQKWVEVQGEGSSVIDWQRTDPLLKHVELNEVLLMDRVQYRGEAREPELEREGYEVLVHGDLGPLMLRKRDARGEQVVLAFHPDRSTLPYRVGFPVMVANFVRQAMQKAGLLEAQANPTGTLPPRVLEQDRSYELRGPGGQRQALQSDDTGQVTGGQLPRVGRYELREGSAVKESLGASLLSTQETSLHSETTLSFREGLTVQATKPLESDRSYWWVLAALALAACVLEWWYYHRPPAPARLVR